MENKLIWGLALCLLFGCQVSAEEKSSRVDALPYYEEASFTPNWLGTDEQEIADFHQIPAFSMVNQEGDTITEADFEGKIYVTDFFFTFCPGICSRMTANMMLLQEAFEEDDEVMLLSHSVTPRRDSVPVLKAYAADRDISATKWHLVTGDQDQIYRLGREAYFVEEDQGLEKDEDDFLHTENFVLIDQNRHIRGIYNGLNRAALNQLIADIKTLKQEG